MRIILVVLTVFLTACQNWFPPKPAPLPAAAPPPEPVSCYIPFEASDYQPSSDSWIALYIAYASTPAEEREKLLQEVRKEVKAHPGPENDLALATLLSQETDRKALNEALAAVPQLDNQHKAHQYSEWLRVHLEKRVDLSRQVNRERNQAQVLQSQNQILQNRIEELEQKIEALTAIEQNLIEQQTETLTP